MPGGHRSDRACSRPEEPPRSQDQQQAPAAPLPPGIAASNATNDVSQRTTARSLGTDRTPTDNLTSMNHFSPRYTPEQKAAVVKLVQGGCTYRQAIEQAAAGIGDLEPFAMPEATARGLMRQLRERRRRQQGEPDPRTKIAEIGRRMLVLLNRELDRAEEAEPYDTGRLLKVATALQYIQKLDIANPITDRTNVDDEEGGGATAFTRQLLRKAQEAAEIELRSGSSMRERKPDERASSVKNATSSRWSTGPA